MMDRVYSPEVERRMEALGSLRLWRRSGLVTREQEAAISKELEPGCYRVNLFVRILLFFFAWSAVKTSLMLLAWAISIREAAVFGVILLTLAACAFLAAEGLVRKQRLYRCGVEEALYLAASTFAAGGVFLILLGDDRRWADSHAMLVGGALWAAAAAAAYLRTGYLYMALSVIPALAVCVASSSMSEAGERTVLSLLYAGLLAASLAFPTAEEPERERRRRIESALLVCSYLAIHVRLDLWNAGRLPKDAFESASFAAVLLIPFAGLALALLRRHRHMLASGAFTALLTVATYKSYLALPRHTWDPVVLGLFLMGLAWALTRWLDAGPEGRRRGFTSKDLLDRESWGERFSGLLAALPVAASGPANPPQASPGGSFGGGQSGGGGATGRF